MEMGYESFKNVGQTCIRALRVDANGILGDVVDCQILHRRDGRFCWIHLENFASALRSFHRKLWLIWPGFILNRLLKIKECRLTNVGFRASEAKVLWREERVSDDE